MPWREHEPRFLREPLGDVVEVLDLDLRVHDLASPDPAPDGGIADEKMRVLGALCDRQRGQLPPPLDPPRRLVAAKQLAGPLDEQRWRFPGEDVQQLNAVELAVASGSTAIRPRRPRAPLPARTSPPPVRGELWPRVRLRRSRLGAIDLQLLQQLFEVDVARELCGDRLELAGGVAVEKADDRKRADGRRRADQDGAGNHRRGKQPAADHVWNGGSVAATCRFAPTPTRPGRRRSHRRWP